MIIKSKTILLLLSLVLLFSFCNCTILQENRGIGKIDSHIHLYDTNREGSCTFLDPDKHAKIFYPHFPADFSKVVQSTDVSHAIVIEASARPEDNDWLIQTVSDSENLLACILNLDPGKPDFNDDIKRYAKNKKFRGIRIRPEKPVDISDPEIVEALGILNELNLVLELGPNQQSTEAIIALAKQYPDMNIIINHLAGGRMMNGKIVPNAWGERLKVLASQPNIYCKVSALYHLSGENPAPLGIENYKPIIDPVLNAFGPVRVLFGSNWTLSEMKGSYTNMIKMLDEYCLQRKDLSAEQFYTLNAINAYGIVLSKHKK